MRSGDKLDIKEEEGANQQMKYLHATFASANYQIQVSQFTLLLYIVEFDP